MIVLCNKLISQTTLEVMEDLAWFEQGKEYVVLAIKFVEEGRGFRIYIQSEDGNVPGFFYLNGFEVVSQNIPHSWVTSIKEINGKKVITMLPEKWNYESFFEDVDDERPEAVALFAEEAKKIYLEEGWHYE